MRSGAIQSIRCDERTVSKESYRMHNDDYNNIKCFNVYSPSALPLDLHIAISVCLPRSGSVGSVGRMHGWNSEHELYGLGHIK